MNSTRPLSDLLRDCDNEQIQFISSIQPFGSLIVADQDRKIIAAAISKCVEFDSATVVGTSVETLLPMNFEKIYASLVGRTEPTTPNLLRSVRLNRWITCIAHQQDGLTILELEPAPPGSDIVPAMKFKHDKKESLEAYLSYIAENVRSAVNFDRVMIYKFAPDWHGEVVAESVDLKAQSFYGHHFPGSDIPLPARTLFTRNWVRMIADVDATHVHLSLSGERKEPIDLSKSILRAPAAIHLEYLRNMGVGASLTLSLICDGTLWGLIACHHLSPKYVNAAERSILSLIAKVVSSCITSLSIAAAVAAAEQSARFTNELSKLVAGEHKQLIDNVRDYKNDLWKMIESDGFSFITNSEVVSDGLVPIAEDLLKLQAFLQGQDQSLVCSNAVATLSSELDSLKRKAAGVLAVQIADGWFVWNRQEVSRSVVWAGNPRKPVSIDGQKTRIDPRSSFESWKEIVNGTSFDWRPYEMEAAVILGKSVSERIASIHKTVSVKAESYIAVLREMIHRQAKELQSNFDNLDLEDLSAGQDI
ncbi:MAG: GAF domain-containing protein [Terriglobales bacterium]